MNGVATPKTPVILMAEDDPDDRLLMEEAVAEAGLGVAMRYVADGLDLVNHLTQIKAGHGGGQESLPELILLDLNMPRMDGREVLEWITVNDDLRHIPVVVLTTTSSPEDRSRVRVLGAVDFLVKPASFEGLVALVRLLPEYWRPNTPPQPDRNSAGAGRGGDES
jgi:CheY-like chemotaxis protein